MLKKIDSSSLGASSNMLQSAFWAEFKSGFGWVPLYFDYNGQPFIVLCRQIGAGYSLCYIPHGPDIKGAGWDLYREIAPEIKKYLPNKCIFIRFDPPWGIEYPSLSKEMKGYPEKELSPKKGFCKANMDIQPPSTVILELSSTEEELLKGMKSKTRYNIKLAEKKGVVVKNAGIEGLSHWYELYKQTALRDKISIHPFNYYYKFFSLAGEYSKDINKPGGAPEVRLLQAEIDGKIEAGIIITIQGGSDSPKRATYLYGASSNNKRNYMPAYALQWEAIKQAKLAGCESYDFFGIPPVDNPDHPMYGLYRFKTGFGGTILHRPGCWDYPCKTSFYNLYCSAEKARAYYYKKLKKRK